MKRLLSFVLSALVLSSCMKEEKPYTKPIIPEQEGEFQLKNNQVRMGEDYETQIYFSLTNGPVASNHFRDWDIKFTTGADNGELWMNGGKEVLIYPTGNKNYEAVTALGTIPATAWKYDNPNGLSGKSGLGILSDQNHIGEVLIVDDGDQIYSKLQIVEITADHYKIKTGPLEASAGSEYTLTKDNDYNYVFYSFSKGIVKPEPPKKDWDLLFTRYRHVYYEYNPDGSDMLYLVNGALTNPYKTTSGKDGKSYDDFYTFSLTNAEGFTLKPDVDVIGFDWKTVNINTGQYTVNPKAIFVVKDQQEGLWKLHFVSFYDENNKKGSPRFEYQRLK